MVICTKIRVHKIHVSITILSMRNITLTCVYMYMHVVELVQPVYIVIYDIHNRWCTMHDDTTTISVLFLAPTSSCYNFWLGCCSILMDSIFCWVYLFKNKIEIVIWCSIKTIYMFFQNVCSFALICVHPKIRSP